jgi:uncharacterized membrane protein YphA (DoxX/SURF4 family)
MKTNTQSSGSRVKIYWVVTVVSALLFAIPGGALVARVPHFAEEMGRLGYPAYFLVLLGVFKVLGAITIVAPRFPRLKEWAYAGMMFDIIGAVVSRAASGDEVPKLVLPVIIACVLTASWALRPASRTLSPILSGGDDSSSAHAMQRAR